MTAHLASALKKIESVIHLPYRRIVAADGQLNVFEGGEVIPFDVKRVFTVRAAAQQHRGDHAHRECTQLMACLSGEIEVNCDDGLGGSDSYILNPQSEALLVPPGIWASQIYRRDDSVLLVLCDMYYDPKDYVRNYQDFITSAKAKLI